MRPLAWLLIFDFTLKVSFHRFHWTKEFVLFVYCPYRLALSILESLDSRSVTHLSVRINMASVHIQGRRSLRPVKNRGDEKSTGVFLITPLYSLSLHTHTLIFLL